MQPSPPIVISKSILKYSGFLGFRVPFALRATLLALLFVCAQAALDLDGPTNGDILTINSPYALTWTSNSLSSHVCVLAVLRCPRSNAPTRLCELVLQQSNLPNSGAYLWTPPTGLSDDAFYRIQLYNVNTNEVATSGTFTFNPYPQDVDVS